MSKKKSMVGSIREIDFVKLIKQYYKVVLFIILGVFIPNYFISGPLHYSGNTPESFILFVTLAFIIFIMSMLKENDNLEKLEKQKLYWPFVFPSALFLGVFIFIQQVIPFLNTSIILLNNLVVWLLYIGFLTIFIFSPKLISENVNKFLIFISMLIVYFILTTLVWNNWLFFSELITPIIYQILLPITEQASYSIPDLPKEFIPMPSLSANNFAVKIGLSCSGIESLTFFISLYFLLILYHFKELKKFKALIVFLIGLMGVFLLNIFRITLLMLIGTKYPEFAMTHFHFNAGWIMFTVFVLVFYYFARDFIVEKPKKKK